jgi:peptide/nickel transport system permease protein
VRTFRKIVKNRLSLAGLIFIVALIVLATLGYLICPDSSPKANDIHLEIALQKPGFKVEMLKTGCKEQAKTPWYIKWLQGAPNECELVPVGKIAFPDSFQKYAENGNGIWEDLNKYVPEGIDEKEFRNGFLVERRFWLGTDKNGLDILSRMIIGARISLLVGFMSVLITLIIGTVLGLSAGYFGGWIDRIVLWLINVVWSLPSLLIAISLSFAFQERGLYQIFLAIGLSMWVELARIVRGQVMQVREMEYIQAARVLGFSHFRILFRHVLPNISAPIIVVCAANFASAILLEAGLSFLGLGVQVPMPSWGYMIKENADFIVQDGAYLAIVPGLAIMFLVMSFNFLGNGLRDALDVNLK